MKILMVNTLYSPDFGGGAEYSIKFLADELAMQGHEVSALRLAKDGKARTYMDGDVNVTSVPTRNIYNPHDGQQRRKALQRMLWHTVEANNLMAVGDVQAVLEREKPDVVHTHNLVGFSVAPWKAAKKLGIPVVHSLRDYNLACPKATMFSAQNGNCVGQCSSCACFSVFKKHESLDVDAVVGVSDFILQRHLKLGYFADAAIKTFIYNSFDKTPLPCRKADGKVVFGYIGRITREKGIDSLIENFMAVAAEHSDVELVIAGKLEDDYGHQLAAAHSGGKVKFVGYQSQQAFFAMIDVLVVSSLWHEPLGRVILEAFAAGRPVIGSRRGGIVELIQDGRNGYLYEPNESGSLRAAMLPFAANATMAPRMRQAALDAVEGISKASVAQDFLDVYQQVLAK